ncbi:hypothetical protein BVRB_031470, partial [Beta vulgaris subsp. vulgaris]
LSLSVGRRRLPILGAWRCRGPVRPVYLKSGTHVWVLYVDLVFLNYDGNPMDAALLAVNGALADLRLPRPIIQRDESGSVLKGDLRVQNDEFAALQIGPRTLSLSLTQIDGHLIADPNADEERLGSGLITIVCNEHDELVSVHKPGGAPIPESILSDAIQVALARCQTLNRSLSKAVSRRRQCH